MDTHINLKSDSKDLKRNGGLIFQNLNTNILLLFRKCLPDICECCSAEY